MAKEAAFITLAAALGLAGAIAFSTFAGGGGELPAELTNVTGLDDAFAQSEATGKPVVAYVTADWCPPCKQMKRTTLQDERVISWLDKNSVPVTLVDGQHNEDMARLPFRAFPTTMVIRDGTVVAAMEGAASSEAYLEFLEGAMAQEDDG
ncbi:MAG: thioredoxin family protein [Planctomycetota bacterium]